MIFEHLRLKGSLGLLAAGVLDPPERTAALAHVGRCTRCRGELAELQAVVAALAADPVRGAEPDVALAVMVARVEGEVERALLTPQRRPRWWLVAVPAAAAALAASVLAPRLVERVRPAPGAARAAIPPSDATPQAAEEALARIERNLARQHAARYLSEAGEVIVAVAATGPDCSRSDGRLDVGEAPERSRALLERRQLVVGSGEAVASARGVLDDVEMTLRELAELPACVKRHDVDHLREQVERRQLLMRIRLMTRELEG